MLLYTLKGALRYFTDGTNYRLVVEGDRMLAEYYRSLLPKWYNANGTRYTPHITVVRWGKEMPQLLEGWGKYEGRVVEYYYDPVVKEGNVYFWLDIFSVELEVIRAELGLVVDSTRATPPEGFRRFFHMTIANRKTSI